MPAKFRRLIRVPKKKTDKLKNRRCSILNATSQDQNLFENTLFYDKILRSDIHVYTTTVIDQMTIATNFRILCRCGRQDA